MSPDLAAGLYGFGENVHHVSQVPALGPKAQDVAIIRHVDEQGGVLITQDRRILKRPEELQALRQSRIGYFVLIGKPANDKWAVKLLFVKQWPEIKQLASKTQRPFAYRIRRTGAKLEPIPL